ncbi:FAD-dependent monooxygenase [Saccharothrix coeruleofusca]|uniref:FAD-dependent oxidoreductase n=1 Tax=Saccharothrix coeruleofusca TaxID=33919 RepID=A0A918EHW0_9PSEU|nr:FAD-dependent monooxygenase [Saccharothrix coeruleofusca]MBP2335488.1 2-polyprenyl-6-methoxyphenol hydroxylase-like FAD-dependent oxidoreductase [Saccharothrix coeruleofusca]GGP85391.1 FAD-dependent oxidoreductase [Saccharothrix coeruleofusca]
MAELAHTPVLIAGGGVTGLSAALFLSWFGVPSSLVERHAEPQAQPKARSVNARTMELYRAIGLEEVIRSVRSPIAEHTVIAHAETLAGPELKRLPDRVLGDDPRLSPCAPALIDQNQLEPLLREHAAATAADVRFHTEVVGVVPRASDVLVTLLDRATGRRWQVCADHLVVADGAHSSIRRMLGIGSGGAGVLARKLNVFFDADLREHLGGRKIVALTVHNPAVHGFFTPVDGVKRWRFAISLEPDQRAADFTEGRCVKLLRAAIGVEDLPVVVDQVWDSVWEVAGRVTDRMRVGRVYVAGDAAHTLPPVGSFGIASGVQDVFNLAWKIDLHHRGLAGDGLLASYESERLPVARETTALTTERYRLLNGAPGDPRTGAEKQSRLVFGYNYRSGAFRRDDAVADGVEDPHHPAIAPGTRAAYAPLADGRSTVDLLGGWALLTGQADAAWQRAAAGADIPVTAHRLAEPEAYRVPEGGAVLVRPDGFVAWRATAAEADGLGEVLDQVLFRRPGSAPPVVT